MAGRTIALLRSGAFRNAVLTAVLAGLAPLSGLAADAHPPMVQPAASAALQMLADVTLIDQECRNVSVIFGKVFQASEAQGVAVVDVMPAGPLRSSFEAAVRQRFAETSHDDLCGTLTARYATQIPGLLAPP